MTFGATFIKKVFNLKIFYSKIVIFLLFRSGQQIEIERTSFISFCDEAEVRLTHYYITLTDIPQRVKSYYSLV